MVSAMRKKVPLLEEGQCAIFCDAEHIVPERPLIFREGDKMSIFEKNWFLYGKTLRLLIKMELSCRFFGLIGFLSMIMIIWQNLGMTHAKELHLIMQMHRGGLL